MDIYDIIQGYPPKKEYLIEMLIDIDKAKDNHCLTEHELEMIANHVNVKVSHLCGIMSFYTLLSTEPRGRFIVQVCKDVPCYLNDGFNVLATIEDILGISLGETTNDRLFTLEHTACIGCCDEAPAMRINDTVYTNLTEDLVYEIFSSYSGENHD